MGANNKTVIEYWQTDLEKFGCPKPECQGNDNVLERVTSDPCQEKIYQCIKCKAFYSGIPSGSDSRTVNQYPILCSCRIAQTE